MPRAAGTRHAQQIEPRHRQDHADPHQPAHPLAHQNPQNGHQDNIEGGEKSRLADGGIGQADLLQAAGNGQQCAADQAGGQQVSSAAGAPGAHPGAAQQGDAGQQKHAAHQKPDGVQRERPHIVQPHALGDKGGAPDHGGEQQHQRAGEFIAVHCLSHLAEKWAGGKNAHRKAAGISHTVGAPAGAGDRQMVSKNSAMK